MVHFSEAFVGIDTSKLRHAVAIADNGRTGEARFLGEIENIAAATAKLARKLSAKCERLDRPVTGCTGRSRASIMIENICAIFITGQP
ncbi:MAG TPA: hypothetical protein VGL31_21425 [Xanthobacteraceae bacterium]|jgi:hypothetical protein